MQTGAVTGKKTAPHLDTSTFNPYFRKKFRRKTMDVSRRQFLKICSIGLGGSSMAIMGFSPTPVLAEARQFKLLKTIETRNTCTYCSVACGLLMYSMGDNAKNSKSAIIHIEGDPDHPVNRGTLCPKGASL